MVAKVRGWCARYGKQNGQNTLKTTEHFMGGCFDGKDNDGDGHSDCDDPDCRLAKHNSIYGFCLVCDPKHPTRKCCGNVYENCKDPTCLSDKQFGDRYVSFCRRFCTKNKCGTKRLWLGSNHKQKARESQGGAGGH